MGPEQLAVEDKKHLGPVQILRFPQVVKLVYQTIQGKNKHTISNDTILKYQINYGISLAF